MREIFSHFYFGDDRMSRRESMLADYSVTDIPNPERDDIRLHSARQTKR